MQIIPQSNLVWNLSGLDKLIAQLQVANYTTIQLGLKLDRYKFEVIEPLSCKLYHNPTWFETAVAPFDITTPYCCKLYHNPTWFETDFKQK